LRIAGRHAPPPEPEPLLRRHPEPEPEPEPEVAQFVVPRFVSAPVHDEAEPEAEAQAPAAPKSEPGNRRTAMAELTALASTEH
jgi:hypothetical protein